MREGWTYKKLGEVATFVNGYPFKPSDWKDSGRKIIRIQNLNNPDAVYNHYDGDIDSKYIVCDGDVLISWSGSLGVFEWSDNEAILNQHIFKVVFNKGKINKRFFEYVVSSRISEMKTKVHGITMQHITKKDFDIIPIPIPPLSEQQRIVSELDLLSNIIEKKKAQLKEYDQLAQSFFYDMFGDPIENPKGWEVKKLGEVCDVRDGTHDSPKYLLSSEYVLITSKNIQGDSIDYTTANFISKEDYDNINKRSFVDDGDIIMAMIGTIGKPIIVHKNNIQFCVKNVALIKFVDGSKVVNVFIKALLDNKSFMTYINGLNKGGTQKFVALGTIRKLSIPLPPLSLQQSFAEKIEAIEKQKELIKQSITETEALFNSRMDYYFN